MPKYTLIVTQMSAVTVEAPSAEALDKALDGESLTDLLEHLDTDPDNWDLATDIKEGYPDAPVEMRLAEKNGEMVLMLVPQHDDEEA